MFLTAICLGVDCWPIHYCLHLYLHHLVCAFGPFNPLALSTHFISCLQYFDDLFVNFDCRILLIPRINILKIAKWRVR